MTTKKRGLGRGLDALLTTSANAAARHEQEQSNESVVSEKGELRKLPVEFLRPGRYQPRKDMSPEALEELASSIKAQGIIQPIVVRPVGNDQYEIIAGERRWRASQLARLDVVPCLVKDVPDEAAVAIALIENIQREDLNALEEAFALQRLIEEFDMTHQAVAEAVGKSRTTVTNLLRVLQLNDDVRTHLERGDIELGHAKVLLAVEGEQQSELARVIVAKGLTVRESEKLVNTALNPTSKKEPQKPDADVQKLERDLADRIGAKVSISHNRKGKGKMVISYNSLDELDGILEHLS
ncbi:MULTISPECIES: ParB/RepB/Spo0J family partition protein [Gammaproteobacteria]|uniref:ParB/RepB/Spo0J family partition protein n=1 Tax=Gammaproteobacteria TaxID=1236 RepID=UPI000DCFC72E|nr:MULTISPECIES: ParB/RepB/Spo0J family partition protein [Gammaproteobacteria]RTE86703.1 ParB/RepB/Spo0J family partition protein [Aliidiomarina sp. B3213]TCZ90743.1 ParB/RepB/Spo0J family partition protein [Lysobacter sp. N42]